MMVGSSEWPDEAALTIGGVGRTTTKTTAGENRKVLGWLGLQLLIGQSDRSKTSECRWL